MKRDEPELPTAAVSDVAPAPAEPAVVTIKAAPHIVRLAPTTVPTAGGSALSIFGTGLEPGCVVRVGGVECAIGVFDEDRIEVVTPALAEGAVDVEVTAADGQTALAAALVFARPAPLVSSISPAEGPLEGGAVLTILGRHFTPGCRVTFFDRAPEATVISEVELQIVCPARHEAGSGVVRVHSAEGLTGELAGGFTYKSAEAPRIDAISPARAWNTGGLQLTVSGAGFRAGLEVTLGQAEAQVVSVAPDRVVIRVPPVAHERTVDVVVKNADGQAAALDGGFTFEAAPAPPKLIDVVPNRAARAGGQTLRLVGANFDEQTVVRIGEVTAPTRFVSQTTLEVTVPPGAAIGPQVIELSDRKGIVVRFEGLFAYEARPPPVVSGVSPPSGFAGNRVRIEGHHFDPGCSVRFARESATHVIVIDESTIDAVVPPTRSPGVVDIVVFPPEGDAGMLKNAFRYETLPPPVIESVAPQAGSPDGGTELSIEGKNFVRATRVLIGGNPAPSVRFVDETTLEIKTPPGASGQMVDVLVRNPDGAESLKRRAFLFDARYRA